VGHGDTFQFVRYLRLIENGGAAITLAVPGAARGLLAANFPGIAVTSFPGIDVTGFDYHVSLISLPARSDAERAKLRLTATFFTEMQPKTAGFPAVDRFVDR
jgi:hypothetical protein